MNPKSTKHSKLGSQISKKPGPLVIFATAIVEPEFGINLGYLARTAANFGMKKLVVVSRESWRRKNCPRRCSLRPMVDR